MGPHDPDHAPEQEDAPPKSTACKFCGEEFLTRSALFRHLRKPAEHCPAPREDAGEKVMLLFGYDCTAGETETTAGDEEETEGAAAAAPARAELKGGERAASLLLLAIGIEGEEVSWRRPAGFSQASCVGSRRCPLLAQEYGVSAT